MFTSSQCFCSLNTRSGPPARATTWGMQQVCLPHKRGFLFVQMCDRVLFFRQSRRRRSCKTWNYSSPKMIWWGFIRHQRCVIVSCSPGTRAPEIHAKYKIIHPSARWFDGNSFTIKMIDCSPMISILFFIELSFFLGECVSHVRLLLYDLSALVLFTEFLREMRATNSVLRRFTIDSFCEFS